MKKLNLVLQYLAQKLGHNLWVSQSAQLRGLSIGVLLGGGLLLSGCSQDPMALKDTDQSGVALPSALSGDPLDINVASPTLHLDANTMYQILAAEMMVQKGHITQAFDVIYGLAQNTQDPQLAERAFQLSMGTYDEQKIAAATVLWRDVSPQSAVAWQASFLISLRRNDVVLALEQWQRYHAFSSVGLDEDLVSTAQRVAASVSANTGIEFMQALTDQFSTEWSAYYALALLAESHNEDTVAISALVTARQYQTALSEPQIARLLAKTYLKTNAPEKGLLALTPYLESHPDDWLVQERVARLEVQAQRYAAAEKRYQLILNAVPDAYTSRLSLALIQIERQSYRDAETNLKQVMTQKGYADVAAYYLGVLFQQQKKYQEALPFFEKVVSSSYLLDAQLHRAEIHFTLKQQDKAFAILNGIEPEKVGDKIKLFRAKAVFYSYQNKAELAIKQYQEVLALAPDNIEALMAQALLLYNLNQFDAYEHNLKRVIALNANEVDALNALGYYYVESNKALTEAESLLKRAFKLAPNSYYVLDSLGWLYYTQKKYTLAAEYLEKALAIQMDDEVLIHLISTYWKLERQDQAKAVWNKYHKKFLQNKRLQSLIKQLETGAL